MVPEDKIGFRYEAPLLIAKLGCEVQAKTPLKVAELWGARLERVETMNKEMSQQRNHQLVAAA